MCNLVQRPQTTHKRIVTFSTLELVHVVYAREDGQLPEPFSFLIVKLHTNFLGALLIELHVNSSEDRLKTESKDLIVLKKIL